MRNFIFFLFLFFSLSAHSAEVNCYSNKTRIYHGYGTDFIFNDEFMVFKETGSSHMIISTADCLVIVREGEKFRAAKQQ